MNRKYERFKPKPRPQDAVILTKKSVAKSQLETAICLWFWKPEPVSILVLAFNAHEILHALGKRIGKPSKLKTWLDTMPKPFRARWEYVWNFCKHGLKDVDEDVSHAARHADILIYFSCLCWLDMCENPTPLTLAFSLRFLLENPNFIDWSAVPFTTFVEVCKETGRRLSRQEFFNEFLPLIEAGGLPLRHPDV